MTEENSNIELTVNDLNIVRQLIGLASKRAAFEPGDEQIAAGQLYNKLTKFFEAVAAEQAAQPQSADEDTAEETGE
mgnify:CR=1 FL=1|jgi:pantothenate synthetase